MTTRPVPVRRLLLAASIPVVMAACSANTSAGQTTGVDSAPAPSGRTAASAATAAPTNCKELIGQAVVAEHAQPMRGIILTDPVNATSQGVFFIAPDHFKWHLETPDAWEEMVSIGGAVYARSSVQDWQPADLLNPFAAAAMKQFVEPPTGGGSAQDLLDILAQAGIANPSVEANLTGPEPSDIGQAMWMCEVIFKSGETVFASEHTWIGANDGLRYSFEHKEGDTVTEMRSFVYGDFLIEGPSS